LPALHEAAFGVAERRGRVGESTYFQQQDASRLSRRSGPDKARRRHCHLESGRAKASRRAMR
jgi:hypothetical protein